MKTMLPQPSFIDFGEDGGDKPAHLEAIRRIEAYLAEAGHGADLKGALFRPINNRTSGDLGKPLNANAVYRLVRVHAETAGFAQDVVGFCTHSLRATAATVPLDGSVAGGGEMLL